MTQSSNIDDDAKPTDPTSCAIDTDSGESRQFGITAHLGLACAAVACLALAANALVRQGTLVERTVEIRTLLTAPAPPAPAPIPQVAVDAGPLTRAIDAFRDAVQTRTGSAAAASDQSLQAAETSLERAAKAYAIAADAALDARETRKLRDGVASQLRLGGELVRLTDGRNALLEMCWSRLDALDAARADALARIPKLFGRAQARESLEEVGRRIDDVRRLLGHSGASWTLADAALAEINVHEAALLAALDTQSASSGALRSKSTRRTSQNDAAPGWPQSGSELAWQFIAARESLLDTESLRRKVATDFGAASAALTAFARTPRTVPDRDAERAAAAAPPAPAELVSTPGEPRTVSTTTTSLDAPWQRQALHAVSGGVLILFLLLSVRMVGRVVGPVRRLLHASQRIAAGDTDQRVERGGIKELDALAGAFNHMAERLAAAQAITREYQQRLEATVEERTRQLMHLAAHDPLTELPNRRELFERLSAALEAAERRQAVVGVFVLDIDNFKHLNDSVGHAYGDRVLQSVAQRLALMSSSAGFSARLGGDEFTVVVQDVIELDGVRQSGEQLLRAFEKPLAVDGHELMISISVGASVYPMHGADSESLLRAADAALFRAKANGRSQLSLYTPDLLDAAATRFTTEQALRPALERGELELVYQPEVDARTLEVGLVEALLRWRRPDGRLAAPAEFLAVAEESGLITTISDWVLRSAITAAADWHRGPWPRARVAINVSARQILDAGFAQRLHGLLAEHRLPAHCIELELTENVLQTGRATIDAVRGLRESGIGIALDDFGTGYSSLASLENLPLTRVKLDQTLVASIDRNPRAHAITSAITELCERLGLEMTAEGIERPDQLALLLRHSGIYLQGYLLSRPVAQTDLPARVREMPARMQSLLLANPVLLQPAGGTRRQRRLELKVG